MWLMMIILCVVWNCCYDVEWITCGRKFLLEINHHECIWLRIIWTCWNPSFMILENHDCWWLEVLHALILVWHEPWWIRDIESVCVLDNGWKFWVKNGIFYYLHVNNRLIIHDKLLHAWRWMKFWKFHRGVGPRFLPSHVSHSYLPLS